MRVLVLGCALPGVIGVSQAPRDGQAARCDAPSTQASMVLRCDEAGQIRVDGEDSTLRGAITRAREWAGNGDTAGGTVTVDYAAAAGRVLAEQLVGALRAEGVADVRIAAIEAEPAAVASQGAASSFQEHGIAVMRALAELGRQLPGVVDLAARSLREEYARLNERAAAAGRAVLDVVKAVEAMQGPEGDRQ